MGTSEAVLTQRFFLPVPRFIRPFQLSQARASPLRETPQDTQRFSSDFSALCPLKSTRRQQVKQHFKQLVFR